MTEGRAIAPDDSVTHQQENRHPQGRAGPALEIPRWPRKSPWFTHGCSSAVPRRGTRATPMDACHPAWTRPWELISTIWVLKPSIRFLKAWGRDLKLAALRRSFPAAAGTPPTGFRSLPPGNVVFCSGLWVSWSCTPGLGSGIQAFTAERSASNSGEEASEPGGKLRRVLRDFLQAPARIGSRLKPTWRGANRVRCVTHEFSHGVTLKKFRVLSGTGK